MHRRLTVIAALLMLCGCAEQRPPRLELMSAAPGEQLLYPLPDGYQVIGRGKRDNSEHVTMVPEGQTEKQCTDMVIAQVFRGGVEEETPEKFAEAMANRWKANCDGAYGEVLDHGQANGYGYVYWWMACTKDGREGRSEHTFAKAIAGKDGFYVVQKAWREAPSSDEIRDWKNAFFDSVQLCDSREPQVHPCPAEAEVFVAK